MPLYYFRCDTCARTFRRIMTPEEAKQPRACVCPTGQLVRDPHPPTSQVTETLDNGIMVKRLERLADAERLFAERYEAVEKNRQGR
jgi:hypothetical protein